LLIDAGSTPIAELADTHLALQVQSSFDDNRVPQRCRFTLPPRCLSD
jgi:hypothetical protein